MSTEEAILILVYGLEEDYEELMDALDSSSEVRFDFLVSE